MRWRPAFGLRAAPVASPRVGRPHTILYYTILCYTETIRILYLYLYQYYTILYYTLLYWAVIIMYIYIYIYSIVSVAILAQASLQCCRHPSVPPRDHIQQPWRCRRHASCSSEGPSAAARISRSSPRRYRARSQASAQAHPPPPPAILQLRRRDAAQGFGPRAALAAGHGDAEGMHHALRRGLQQLRRPWAEELRRSGRLRGRQQRDLLRGPT